MEVLIKNLQKPHPQPFCGGEGLGMRLEKKHFEFAGH